MRLFNWKIFNESIEDVESVCVELNIQNWTLENGLINVGGRVNLFRKNLTKLPLKFGEVVINGKKVNLQLLKYAFDDLQLEFPNIEYIEGYEII